MFLRSLFDRFYFAPDDAGGAAVVEAPTPGFEETPAPAPDVASTVSVAPATPEGATAASTAVAPSPPPDAIQSVRQYGEQLGYPGAQQQFPDDGAFVQHLLSEARERQRLAQIEPYAQQYMQHAAEFQQWQQSQRQAAQQPAPAKKLFDLPEWKPEWNALLTRDDKGNVVPVQGADPALVAKYHTYQQARSDLANRFLSDPENFLGPVVEQRVSGLLDKTIQERLTAYEQKRANEQYLQQNSEWLFARDQSGQQLRQPTGQPVLSPVGQSFVSHLKRGAELGMNDVAQRQFAEALVRSELMAQHLARLQPDAGKQAVIEANRLPNRGGSFHGSQPGGNGTPQNQALSLKDRLKMTWKEVGMGEEL